MDNDILLVLTEHFFAKCYGCAVQAKRNRKSSISHQRGHFDKKIQVEGVDIHQLFLRG